MRTPIITLALCCLLAACASASPESDPAYVSPAQYEGYNCKQIKAEMQRVSKKIDIAVQTDGTTQALDAAVTIFAMSQGYGVNGGSGNVELRRLKNQYEILEQSSIQKECGL